MAWSAAKKIVADSCALETFETVCVINGYIGLPTAALIADRTKVFACQPYCAQTCNGRSGIEERGLDVLVTKAIDPVILFRSRRQSKRTFTLFACRPHCGLNLLMDQSFQICPM